MAGPETATTVRVQDGTTLTTDGPFAEIKEAIGSYLFFEADDLDDQAARRPARFRDGELVLLEDQDRTLWDARLIARGRAALERALALRGRGPYVLQGGESPPCTPTSRATAADRRPLRGARPRHGLAGRRAQPGGRGRRDREARDALTRALELARDDAERRLLERRLAGLPPG
jgi:RNA polymerase sigma-70 factor (ECF subfamily)